jgi:hypothetical protein
MGLIAEPHFFEQHKVRPLSRDLSPNPRQTLSRALKGDAVHIPRKNADARRVGTAQRRRGSQQRQKRDRC